MTQIPEVAKYSIENSFLSYRLMIAMTIRYCKWWISVSW